MKCGETGRLSFSYPEKKASGVLSLIEPNPYLVESVFPSHFNERLGPSLRPHSPKRFYLPLVQLRRKESGNGRSLAGIKESFRQVVPRFTQTTIATGTNSPTHSTSSKDVSSTNYTEHLGKQNMRSEHSFENNGKTAAAKGFLQG